MALTPGPAARQPWLIRRFGRRGLLLMLIGALYVATGAITLGVETIRRFDDLPLVGAILDSPWWGLMWLGAGVVAIVVGLVRPSTDGAGWVALLLPSALWTIFYAASLMAWMLSGGIFGRPTAAAGIFVWSITWTVVLIVAGWPEITQTPEQPPEQGDDSPGGPPGRRP